MTLEAKTLASGPGWRIRDLICSAGPRDPAFEEQHDTVAIAAVLSGTFQYRTSPGSAVLAPGAVLLGNHGQCFECAHEHGVGDRCLSFHFAPDYWEDVVAAVPRARRARFVVPRVPPVPSLLPMVAAVETAWTAAPPELEELALQFAGAVLGVEAGLNSSPRRPSARDERRISDALRRIEPAAQEPSGESLSVAALAQEAGVSPYHFLRTFRRLVGVTPYQYVLRMRLQRAAVRLRSSKQAVAAIAFDAGFNDLSTFNRRFRRVLGASPSIYRAAAKTAGSSMLAMT